MYFLADNVKFLSVDFIFFNVDHSLIFDFPGGSDSKASAYNMGDLGSIPGLG